MYVCICICICIIHTDTSGYIISYTPCVAFAVSLTCVQAGELRVCLRQSMGAEGNFLLSIAPGDCDEEDTCIYVCVYVCICMRVCVCVYIYIYVCVCVCIYIYTCIHGC